MNGTLTKVSTNKQYTKYSYTYGGRNTQTSMCSPRLEKIPSLSLPQFPLQKRRFITWNLCVANPLISLQR